MEAMILAAGAGTRLLPITDRMPKALIEIGGRPLLGHVMDRLVAAGATRLIVNTHYHETRIANWLQRNAPAGVEVALSPEPGGPYDTGGGLLAAAPLFRRDGPFLLHNVDVLSRIPLDAVLGVHRTGRTRGAGEVLATVAVQARPSTRRLLFDHKGLLGWENCAADGRVTASERVRDAAGSVERRSFTGIHVVEPAVFDRSERTGVFSIITWYLDLARRGFTILPADVSDHAWIDVGTPQRLADAEQWLSRNG